MRIVIVGVAADFLFLDFAMGGEAAYGPWAHAVLDGELRNGEPVFSGLRLCWRS